MIIAQYIGAVGVADAVLLLAALLAAYFGINSGFWPVSAGRSLKNTIFWLLFRTANTVSFILDLSGPGGFVQTSLLVRVAASLVAISCALFFLLSLVRLGKPNSYGGREGLIQEGVYRFSRNPQYAALVVMHGSLAVVADTPWAFGLASLLAAIFSVMALLEEKWLIEAYGEEYRLYALRAPRIIGIRGLRFISARDASRFRDYRTPRLLP